MAGPLMALLGLQPKEDEIPSQQPPSQGQPSFIQQPLEQPQAQPQQGGQKAFLKDLFSNLMYGMAQGMSAASQVPGPSQTSAAFGAALQAPYTRRLEEQKFKHQQQLMDLQAANESRAQAQTRQTEEMLAYQKANILSEIQARQNKPDPNVGKTITTEVGGKKMVMGWNPQTEAYDKPQGNAPGGNLQRVTGTVNGVPTWGNYDPETGKILDYKGNDISTTLKPEENTTEFEDYFTEKQKVEEDKLGRPLNIAERVRLKETSRQNWGKDPQLAAAILSLRNNQASTLDEVKEARHRVAQSLAGEYDPKSGKWTGDLTPLRMITSMRQNERILLYDEIKQRNPAYNTSDIDRKVKMMDWAENGKGADQLQSYGTFLQHAGAVTDVLENVRLTDAKILNLPWNKIREMATSNPELAKLVVSLEPVRKEFMAFLLNNRALYESDRQEMIDMVGESQPPKVLLSSLNQMGHTAEARYKEINGRFKRVIGQDIPDPFTPEAIDAARKLGIKLSSGGRESATSDTTIAVGTIRNGYRFKGGNPNDQNSWEPLVKVK